MIRRVAILGGGPAGSFAATQLASAGLAVQLFDEKLAWEKPCGGGLTFKAYHQYPFLLHNATPKRLVTETTLGVAGAGQARLKLHDPLVIYSRLDLNRMLLDRAERAGAQLEKTRVLEMSRAGPGWRLRTGAGTAEADYCILATGARNSLRDFGTQLHPRDTMVALGYYVAGDQENIDIQFLDGLEGYIWVFPRCGHLSVGICGKGVAAFELRKRLDLYMNERGISSAGARFYSHLLPCLDKASWRHNRVAGDGWMAVGDAAGLVDPITGEGIYYAIRSGDLAAQALLAEAPAAETAAAIPPPVAARFRDRSRIRLAARQARIPRPLSLRAAAPAHGGVHPPQPALCRRDGRSVRRPPALYRPEATPADQPQRQPLRDRHEPGLQPGRAVALLPTAAVTFMHGYLA